MLNDAAPTSSVLFLCTGNYYRSRYAQAVFNHYAQQHGMPWQAFSRGLMLVPEINPGPLSIHTRRALDAQQIDLRLAGEAPQALQRADLERATFTIALKEAEHRPMMQAQFPDFADTITYWNVHDLDCATPEEALPMVGRLVREFAEKLNQS